MRSAETVTPHVYFSNLEDVRKDQEFTLKTLGQGIPLKRHDAARLQEHSGRDIASAAFPEGQFGRLTHSVEDGEFLADAICFQCVGSPSSRPGAVSDETAVVFRDVDQVSGLAARPATRRRPQGRPLHARIRRPGCGPPAARPRPRIMAAKSETTPSEDARPARYDVETGGIRRCGGRACRQRRNTAAHRRSQWM